MNGFDRERTTHCYYLILGMGHKRSRNNIPWGIALKKRLEVCLNIEYILAGLSTILE